LKFVSQRASKFWKPIRKLSDAEVEKQIAKAYSHGDVVRDRKNQGQRKRRSDASEEKARKTKKAKISSAPKNDVSICYLLFSLVITIISYLSQLSCLNNQRLPRNPQKQVRGRLWKTRQIPRRAQERRRKLHVRR